MLHEADPEEEEEEEEEEEADPEDDANAEDLKRFQDPDVFQECLEKKWMRFEKGSYLVELHNRGENVKRHQELPERSFWCTTEVMQELSHELIRKESPIPINQHPARFLNVISYRWLQPGHPDRSGHHLRIVVALVRKMVASREVWSKDEDGWKNGCFCEMVSYATDDVALFWDFLSLPQLPRNTAEQARFTAGLGFCNVLYGHTSTAVWLQTQMSDAQKGRLNKMIHLLCN